MLDVLDAAAERSARFVYGLAVLLRDDARDLLEVFLEERLELEEVPGALHHRRLAPFRKGFARGAHRFADFGGAAHRDPAERLACGGIGEVVPVRGRRSKPF